jgi:hypothetical protein
MGFSYRERLRNIQVAKPVCDHAKFKKNTRLATPSCGLFLTCRGKVNIFAEGIYTHMYKNDLWKKALFIYLSLGFRCEQARR